MPVHVPSDVTTGYPDSAPKYADSKQSSWIPQNVTFLIHWLL